MTDLLARDSTNGNDIPVNGIVAVMGYGDGIYQWTSDMWARFPGLVPLSIVVSANSVGDILDVETGDATPADCPGWADRFNRANRRRPTIYCNRSTIDSVRVAMGNRPFDWWAATLDGTKDVPGAVAVQYAGESQTGGHYDETIITDPTWIGLGGTTVYPKPPADWWGWAYVPGATLAVELPSNCHSPVIATTGTWFRFNTVIEATSIGQFAEWSLANLIGSTWYDMDESGGPAGSPVGRLAPDQSYWVTDVAIDTSGCGGTDPIAVAIARGGKVWDVSGGPTPPTPPTPPPPPPPPPPPAIDVPGAIALMKQALAKLGA